MIIMYNTSRNSESYSSITLKQIIQLWSERWCAENSTYCKWVEYTRSGIRRKITSLFGASQLWKEGAQGLEYFCENRNRVPVQGNENWLSGKIHLRGVVVVHCQKKISCKKTGQYHYKYGIHISEIFKDLTQYAKSDSSIEKILLHLECEERDVYFKPVITLNLLAVEESETNKKNNQESENESEIDGDLPPPSIDDEINSEDEKRSDISDLPPPSIDDEFQESLSEATTATNLKNAFVHFEPPKVLDSDDPNFSKADERLSL